MDDKFLKPYNPQESEKSVYEKWEKSGLFNPDVCIEKGVTESDAKPFSIIMPPPNANGSLHAGHALFVTLQDVMTRVARMQGKKTLWLPGADHAGFETQVVYEKKLQKEGRSRFQMEPKELYNEILEFTQSNKNFMERVIMKEVIYKRIYTTSMVVLGVSLVFMLFVQGVVPFGVSAVWSEKGLGSSLVFVRADSTVQSGNTVVGSAEVQRKVNVYVVQDVVRQNGALHYRVSDSAVVTQELITIPAQDLGRVALLSVPVMGVWVKMLSNALGVLTLIGLPFLMLSINILIHAGKRLLPVLRVFERRAVASKERKIQRKVERQKGEVVPEESLPVEDIVEGGLVTVLKPYNMKQRYGM